MVAIIAAAPTLAQAVTIAPITACVANNNGT
jgi:hypothetical protein